MIAFNVFWWLGILIHWSKNAYYTLILDHLWIINISKEILRPINRYSNLRKNMKSKAASPLQFYILGIIEVYLNIECFTKINLTANILPQFPKISHLLHGQNNFQNSPHLSPDTSRTDLVCIFSLILNHS